MTSRAAHAPLRRFFTGLAECAFQTRLGVADPPLVDYLAALLTDFVRCDRIFRLRKLSGDRLEEVAEMLLEAQQRVGDARREVHRHVGDFTLFWTGVYPEALDRLQGESRKDRLVNYTAQGKRAYYIASTMRTDQNAQECDVLERISLQFELCAFGLNEIRREWERRDPAQAGQIAQIWIN